MSGNIRQSLVGSGSVWKLYSDWLCLAVAGSVIQSLAVPGSIWYCEAMSSGV